MAYGLNSSQWCLTAWVRTASMRILVMGMERFSSCHHRIFVSGGLVFCGQKSSNRGELVQVMSYHLETETDTVAATAKDSLICALKP